MPRWGPARWGPAEYKLKSLSPGPHEISLAPYRFRGTILSSEKKTNQGIFTMKLTAVAFFAVLAFAAGQSLDDCLQQDSISCVQKSLYRRARAFFEQSTLEIVPGVNLVKSKDNERSARSGEQAVFDQQIETAANVVDRQSALEGFVGEEVDRFMAKRSLKVSISIALLYFDNLHKE